VAGERLDLFRRAQPVGMIGVTAAHTGLDWRRLWGRERKPPDPGDLVIRSLLLASEGRPISSAAIDLAARIAGPSGGSVHVLSIARVWGTAFGLPNPGLLPSRREWEEQRRLVAEAVLSLQRRGIQAAGQVLGTRGAAKRIVAEAYRHHCDAIVMTADPPRHWLIGNLLWSHEPYRVRRLAKIPTYLTVDAAN
jgi:nucleotide-binding universal stress UspA family protein